MCHQNSRQGSHVGSNSNRNCDFIFIPIPYVPPSVLYIEILTVFYCHILFLVKGVRTFVRVLTCNCLGLKYSINTVFSAITSHPPLPMCLMLGLSNTTLPDFSGFFCLLSHIHIDSIVDMPWRVWNLNHRTP